MSVVDAWLSPKEAEQLGAAAGRTLDRDLFRDLAVAVGGGNVKAKSRKAATNRLRRYLSIAEGCAPAKPGRKPSE